MILTVEQIILPGLSRQKPLGLTPATNQIEACQNRRQHMPISMTPKGGPPKAAASCIVNCIGMCCHGFGMPQSVLLLGSGPGAFAG